MVLLSILPGIGWTLTDFEYRLIATHRAGDAVALWRAPEIVVPLTVVFG